MAEIVIATRKRKTPSGSLPNISHGVIMRGVMMKYPYIEKSFFNAKALVIYPELAAKVGLNEAIVLNQLKFWIDRTPADEMHYHQGKVWIFNSIKMWSEQFPFWSSKTISRILLSLEKKGFVLSGDFNKNSLRTKWYTIDYDRLEEFLRESCESHKDNLSVVNETICHESYGQNVPTTYITTKNTSKSTLLEGVENDTMNPNKTETAYDENIVEREINKSLSTVGIKEQPMRDEMMNVVLYYYEAYRNKFGIEHPRISQKNMDKVIEKLRSGTDLVADADLEQYMQMIDKHLNTVYPDCNYSILHFISDGIMDNKFYETCY